MQSFLIYHLLEHARDSAARPCIIPPSLTRPTCSSHTTHAPRAPAPSTPPPTSHFHQNHRSTFLHERLTTIDRSNPPVSHRLPSMPPFPTQAASPTHTESTAATPLMHPRVKTHTPDPEGSQSGWKRDIPLPALLISGTSNAPHHTASCHDRFPLSVPPLPPPLLQPASYRWKSPRCISPLLDGKQATMHREVTKRE